MITTQSLEPSREFYVQLFGFDVAMDMARDSSTRRWISRHTAELIEGSPLALFPEHRHLSMITGIPRVAADLRGEHR